MGTVIRKHQFREMPWKNGLGLTQEIDIFPPHSDITKGDFHWRLSSAYIKTANSFSLFPGYDRLLTVISGHGLKLNGIVLQPLTVQPFSGEDHVECQPVKDDVVDLGIIFKRDQYRCDIQIVSLMKSEEIFFGDGTHYLLGVGGGLSINGNVLNDGDVWKTERNELAKIEVADHPQQLLKISVQRIYQKK